MMNEWSSVLSKSQQGAFQAGTGLATIASMGAEHCQDTATARRLTGNCSSIVFDDDTTEFYREAVETLTTDRVPFLVGGTFALSRYTTVDRQTKDLDVFVKPEDCRRAMESLENIGCTTEWPFPHWLAKAKRGEAVIDIIYSSGNGVAAVDEEWFAHAEEDVLYGVPVKICPPEEMLWSKSFVMERERFDGADVLHILHGQAPRLNWERILERFGDHWRVLLSHLILYSFVYPAERSRVPAWVTSGLTRRLEAEGWRDDEGMAGTCLGTLVSRQQYLSDLQHEGYEDGRIVEGRMTPGEIARWTEAIKEKE